MLFFAMLAGVVLGPVMIGNGAASQKASNKKWQAWEDLSISQDFVERKCVVHAVVSCFNDESFCSGGSKPECYWKCVERHTYLFALQQETTVEDSNKISNTTELSSSLAEETRSYGGGHRMCGEDDPLYLGPSSQPEGCTRQEVGQKAAHRSAECGRKCDFEPLGPAPFQVGGEYPCWEPSQQLEGSERLEAYQSIAFFCGNTRCRKLSDPSIHFEELLQKSRDDYNRGVAQLTAGIIVTVASCCFCIMVNVCDSNITRCFRDLESAVDSNQGGQLDEDTGLIVDCVHHCKMTRSCAHSMPAVWL